MPEATPSVYDQVLSDPELLSIPAVQDEVARLPDRLYEDAWRAHFRDRAQRMLREEKGLYDRVISRF